MILNDPTGRPYMAGIGGRATLDDLFRRAASRRPDAVALIDPPNRESVTDGPARRLTYAQADRMVSAIAGRLRRIGLQTDAIVGLQLANTVESVLTLLGVLRAGLIAMPLPLLWRREDAVDALGRVGANALIVSGRIGHADHFDLALRVAAEVFPIRHVCGYGLDPPEGLVPFDDLYTVEKLDPLPPLERERAQPPGPGPGAHLAAITWDVSADGLVPVGRNHGELIAGGLAVLLEGRFGQDAVTLSTLPLSSFAGLATSLMPWLLLGGTLVLHHPFDPDVFAGQCRSIRCDCVIVPGPLVPQFAEAGHLRGFGDVIAVWRAPERLARAPAWRDPRIGMTDVQVFGEIGVIAARRDQTGKPAAVAFGPVAAPRDSKGAIIVGEVQPTARGTVALRGPMVPRCAFPPGAERTAMPHLKVAADGFVDTGYGCVNGRDAAALAITGPPPGVVSVGGYRFVLRALQDAVGQIEGDATLAALPDALCGNRLAGSGADRDAIAAALAERGVNPLVIGAFRERRRPAA
jgi:hypothetical protein